MNTIVVGLQNGDEGKGRVCDQFMDKHDICVRFSGGPNTGATVWVNDEKFKFHHIPVGILYNKPCYIGAGCYIYPPILLEEIKTLKEKGYDIENLLRISHAAHIITEEHIQKDIAKEAAGGVGSTKRGISPCSVSKYGREGIRTENIKELEKYVSDISFLLDSALSFGQSIMFEGSQGLLLDVDNGFYPYVSTSPNVAAAACTSCGFSPLSVNQIIGVFKPYCTKVGKGPFPTKITDETIAEDLVSRGSEYGTTTGRKRDVGWLDLPLLKYAMRINGCTHLAMTKFDIVRDLPKVKVCTHYNNLPYLLTTLPEKRYQILSPFLSQLEKAEPVYVEVKGEDLPDLIESYINKKIDFIFASKNRSVSSTKMQCKTL